MSALTLSAPAPSGAGVFVTRHAPSNRHLLALEGLSRSALLGWLDDAERERAWLRRCGPNRDDLAGSTVMLAFIEDSTRTRTSFELAARRLGANVLTFTAATSSINKGETLLDTMRVFEAMGAQLLVVRHSQSGFAAFLAHELPKMAVVNAGDGTHEHPTQGLLDLLTLRDAWAGRFEGRRLAIVGDIAHSRVARSAIAGLLTLGAHVVVCGPASLVPADLGAPGCTVVPSLDDALAGADAVMALRIQRERMEAALVPSPADYARLWGLDAARVARLNPGAVVLHPGPVNRGVELSEEVADGPRSVILQQVANGVAVRCAVLKRCWTEWKQAA